MVALTDSGRNVAEISTLAFYHGSPGGTIFDAAKVISSTAGNGTVYTGILFTGAYNTSTNTPNLGIGHESRPLGISFEYFYTPVSGDNCLAYAKVIDITIM